MEILVDFKYDLSTAAAAHDRFHLQDVQEEEGLDEARASVFLTDAGGEDPNISLSAIFISWKAITVGRKHNSQVSEDLICCTSSGVSLCEHQLVMPELIVNEELK
ncbi:hypothetical protein H920_08584 [Fukomys damarensis]|uniref:Uncharacterized protein n=1 Tax=Fukomys damarensis TaxID=885580 RepID=A0A091E4F3_FUKDA|nr:hypothetical protein H920_08584 [Fukomys damarensis]